MHNTLEKVKGKIKIKSMSLIKNFSKKCISLTVVVLYKFLQLQVQVKHVFCALMLKFITFLHLQVLVLMLWWSFRKQQYYTSKANYKKL